MGVRTGKPRGRPKGAKNRRTQALEAAVKETAEILEDVIPDAFEGDAHAFLMKIYKDPAQDIHLRVDAAKAAVRYEKPALAAVDVTAETTITYDVADEPLSEDEWAEHYGVAH